MTLEKHYQQAQERSDVLPGGGMSMPIHFRSPPHVVPTTRGRCQRGFPLQKPGSPPSCRWESRAHYNRTF
jgi:hypothetical protein